MTSLPGYGGCKSWIELDSDIATEDAQPVLDEKSFAEKLLKFQGALSST